MSLASGTRLGPYEVVGLIGVGGMGEVYRARDTRLDRDVATDVTRAADRLPAYAWSSDGKRLVVVRGTQTADMVLIKGVR